MLNEKLKPTNPDLSLSNNNKTPNNNIDLYDENNDLDKSFSDKISERLSSIKTVFRRERLGFFIVF